MDVKKGYKQTEVGILPKEWEVKTFKDICWVNQGLQIVITSRFKNPTPKSKLYITIQFLHDGKEAEYIEEYSSSVCCEKDDVLMTRTGNTGIVISGVEGVFHNNFFKINYDKKKINKNYLIYYLRQEKTQKIILIKAGTSTIPDLNHSDFYSIPVPLPTLTEQQAIAEALSDADALLESLEHLLAKKRQIKQGAMQELLTGRRRLEGFVGEPGYKQSEVGMIPNDWDTKHLGEIGTSIIGLTYKPSDVRDNGVLVLRSSNIQEGVLRFEDNVFVEMDIPEKLMVIPDDILVCVRNGSRDLIGKCALIDDQAKGMTFGAFMTVFRSPLNKFVYHQFQSNIIKKQIHEHLGATINQITNKSMNSFIIPLPAQISEQTAIADILSDMDAEIAALEAKLVKARQVKQGMMQELLTGRVRLIGGTP